MLLDDVGNFILWTFIQLVCAKFFQWSHRCRSVTPYFYSVIKVIKDFLFKCFFPPNYNYHFTTKKSLPELEKLIECLYARKACQSIGPLRVPKNTSLLMLPILFFFLSLKTVSLCHSPLLKYSLKKCKNLRVFTVGYIFLRSSKPFLIFSSLKFGKL